MCHPVDEVDGKLSEFVIISNEEEERRPHDDHPIGGECSSVGNSELERLSQNY